MKKKILILLLLIIAVASSALKAQDWWVVQLPHQGVAECMLDVGDGYVCLAKVIDESVEGYPLTLYKYSKTGELLWYKQYYHIYEHFHFRDFIQTSDGGFLIVGTPDVMMKLDNEGNVEFTVDFYDEKMVYLVKAYELVGEDIYGTYVQDDDFSDPGVYPLLVNSSGDIIEIDSLHGFSYVGGSPAISVENIGDGELYLSRGNFNYNLSENFFSDFDFNPSLEHNYKAYKMIYPSKDGGYYRIPDNYHFEYPNDQLHFIKYDENMDSLWAHEYSDYLYGGVNSISWKATTSLNNGGYILAGEAENDIFQTVYIVKTDENANKEWIVGYSNTIFQNLAPKAIAEADDGGLVFFTFGRHSTDDYNDMFLVKTNKSGGLSTNILEQTTTDKMFLYPNPATSKITINFSDNFTGDIMLINAAGTVLTKKQIKNTFTHTFNINNLSKGTYFVKAKSDDNSILETKKIIKN